MKNFKDGGFRNGGKDFGGRSKFGGRNDFGGGHSNREGGRGDRFEEKKEMFSATCTTCNKQCDVPFRPSGDKPVYCSACFGQRSSEGSREGRERGNSFDKGRHEQRSERTDFTKPRVEKSQSDRELAEIKHQLIAIESRLNRILDLINPPMPAVKAIKPVTEVATPAVKNEVAPKKAKTIKKVVAKVEAKKIAVKKVATKKVAKKVVKKVAKKAKK